MRSESQPTSGLVSRWGAAGSDSSEDGVRETLDSIPWREMIGLERFDQLERRSEDGGERFGIMPFGWEPAALARPGRGEGGNREVTA